MARRISYTHLCLFVFEILGLQLLYKFLIKKKSTPKPLESSDDDDEPLPNEMWEEVFSHLSSSKDRNSVSLVCNHWFNLEKCSRTRLLIRNSYYVSPEIVSRRFSNIRSVTMKGSVMISEFGSMPQRADLYPWLLVFAKSYKNLEELRLKGMFVSDESLAFLAHSFPTFKALAMVDCDGFSLNGLRAIATYCKNLTEINLQGSIPDDIDLAWISCFPEKFESLEVLNIAKLVNLNPVFDLLERLVSRCRSLKVLKVNSWMSKEQLLSLLIRAPQLTVFGVGSLGQELLAHEIEGLKRALSKCTNLRAISGLPGLINSCYIHALFPVYDNLTFLNLKLVIVHHNKFVQVISQCRNLRRLWVPDMVLDEGLQAVGRYCPSLEELRVFRAIIIDLNSGVTGEGLVHVSHGCHKLQYIYYYCKAMTNSAIVTVVNNCPNLTHFRIPNISPQAADRQTNEPFDEGYGYLVQMCKKLRRLEVSGLVTDQTFEDIGLYAKNLEILAVELESSNDLRMLTPLQNCPKLRKLELKNCFFGRLSITEVLDRYGIMRYLWRTGCQVTTDGCIIRVDYCMPDGEF